MKVYASDIVQMMDLPGAELLTQERYAHMRRYLKAEDRARCLTAGLMLRCILGGNRAASIRRTRLGKPFLPGGPCFNLSHSGNRVVLAVDETDLGVDIEQIISWPPAVARKVFRAEEQNWLWQQGTDAAFYRLWTGKEAVMKALGLGFQLPPESFEVLPDSTGPNLVCGRGWYLHWREIDGCMMCTASEHPEEPHAPIQLSRDELLQV